MKFNSKKKLFLQKGIFFFVTMIFLGGTIFSAYGKSVSEMKKERTEITKNIETVKNNIKELEYLKSIAKTEMDSIDIELTEAVIELERVEGELTYTEEILDASEKELVVATKERESQYKIFKQRFAVMYESGNIGYIDTILEAENFSDMMKRIEYINHIIEYDNNIVDNLVDIEDYIKDTIEEIEKNKSEIEVLLYEQKIKKENLEVKLNAKNEYIAKIEVDETEFQKQMDILDSSDKELEKLIKEEEQKMMRSVASSDVSSFTYSGGKLGWPVPGRTKLSSGYVSRNSPISGKGEFHTGLDIPAPTGTSIVAAEDGVVLSSGWQNGYGYTVVLSHGDGLSTLYGHNSSLVVSKGESVVRGQVIAKAGSTGYSTGPHCHFEVRINGKHTDPNSYLQ